MATVCVLRLLVALAGAMCSAGQPSLRGPTESGNLTVAVAGAADAGSGAAYSQADAVHFAYLSRAAFCHDIGQSWDCGPCRNAPDTESVRVADDFELSTHAYVAKSRGQCVVVFRGTDYAAAWLQDLRSIHLVSLPGCSAEGQPCSVGEGFLQDYLALAPRVKANLEAIGCGKENPLAITGHSLGGALATLALFDLKRSGYNVEKVYTFGQPRVGDSVFAKAFGEVLGNVPYFRVTKFDDPVPLVPPRGPCEHVGTEVYFWGPTSFKLCAGSEDGSCADSRRSSLWALTLKCAFSKQTCGHRTYFPPQHPFLLQCRAPAQGWFLLFP